MVYLHAFGHVDTHFSGNKVGSFLHSACSTEIVSIITFLPWALLSWYKQSQNRFFSHIYCIDWVLSHKSSQCHPGPNLASWSIDCIAFVTKAWGAFFIYKKAFCYKKCKHHFTACTWQNVVKLSAWILYAKCVLYMKYLDSLLLLATYYIV